MPAAPAIIMGVAAIAGSVIASRSQSNAAKTQKESQDQAIQLAKDQEVERKREYDQQMAAAAYQWKQNQANLAPYRRARAAVLGEYGIDANVEDVPMPEGYGMPGGPAPVNGPGGGVVAPRPAGGGGGLMALAGLAGGTGAVGQYLARRPAGPPSPYTNMPGTYTNSQPGTYGGPPGPPAPPQIDPASLANWSDWSNYGVPGQSYQGE